MKVYAPEGSGPCAKANVVATLVTSNGEHFQSNNFCMKPQEACPRDFYGYKAGEGYHLCKEICKQVGHAEENVISFVKAQRVDVAGSTIYVDYTWVCDNCKKISALEGIDVKIGDVCTSSK